ncbi:MAG: two-component system alkaline phosphatase synthesis response regulator PhoP [Sphingobacteriales bacterium]|jgi:two-component system alkaline phosphatase synthesis response regulator PhoP
MGTILVVEDEQSLRELVVLNLEMEGYAVEFAESGFLADEKVRNFDYDLVVLDVMLPKIDGFTLCKGWRNDGIETPILFLSARSSPEERIEGLKLGGDDYLTKPFELDELLLRVGKRIRKQLIKTEIAIGDFIINTQTYVALSRDMQKFELTKREIELLQLMDENRGKVVSRDKILDRIWGENAFPTARTIDNYFMNFRKYFELDSKNPTFFLSIRGVGYKLN